MDPQSALLGLDEEQRAAATTFGQPLAIVAPPGSGKTRTITARLAYGIASGELEASHCLALTFTTRAAAQLQARMSAFGAPPVAARTIHAAALRQLRFFWGQTSSTHMPTLASDREGLVAQAREHLRLADSAEAVRETAAHIGWAKASMLGPDDFAAAFEAQMQTAPRGSDATELARVYTEYERIKAASALMDFDDVLLFLVGILDEQPEALAQVRRTYRHLTIDEFQDTTPLQFLLIRQWAGRGRDLCVVGDPDQAIYGFAGADPAFLRGFASHFPGADVIYLTRTYRCGAAVVQAAGHVGGERAAMRAARADGQASEVSVVDALDDVVELDVVADRVQQLLASGVPAEEIAVLTRQQDRADAFAGALRGRGFPVLMRGMAGFFMRPEVKRALLTLRAEHAQRSVIEAVTDIVTRAGWTPEQSDDQPYWDSYTVLMRLAESLAAHDPSMRAEDLLVEVHQRAEALELPPTPAVSVLTMHAAKGLEWDAVIVTSLVESVLPHAYARGPAAVEEERRLLFVAMTRARSSLTLTHYRKRRGEPCEVSRFLANLPLVHQAASG